MHFWKSVRYRLSLIQRGEIEVVTVERLLFFLVRVALLIAAAIFLYIALREPIILARGSIIQAFSKAKA
jgi:hypothetical protein